MDAPAATAPNFIYDAIRYMHIWSPCLALIIALLRSRLFGRISLTKFAEELLSQMILWVIGLESLVVFILHTWFPDATTATAGWAATPLIYQLGIVNLSFGILGFVSLLSSIGFKTATTLGYSIWLFGIGIGHWIFIMKGITDPANIDFVLYTDLVVPLIFMVLLMIVYQNQKSKA